MRLSKKLAAVAVTAGVALTATAAFAYWTTDGGGSGTAGAAGSSAPMVITGNAAAGITPGGSVAVTGNIQNPNSSSTHVDVVSAVITTSDDDCLATDLHFAPVNVNALIPANGNQTFSGTLTMADTTLNQDACKSALITLTYSSTSL